MNYFTYFSEIEQRFIARRGSLLLLSTLDWALIESWREAGVPLEAVLRGIDAAFDKHDQRAANSKARLRKVNGLAWCAQSVMEATEAAVEAATGAQISARVVADSGFEEERVAAYLERTRERILKSPASSLIADVITHTAQRLTELAAEVRQGAALDDGDRALTLLEERLVAALVAAAPEAQVLAVRADAETAMAPYRAKMPPAQRKQVLAQYEQKRLLEAYALPRLSLFYMEQS